MVEQLPNDDELLKGDPVALRNPAERTLAERKTELDTPTRVAAVGSRPQSAGPRPPDCQTARTSSSLVPDRECPLGENTHAKLLRELGFDAVTHGSGRASATGHRSKRNTPHAGHVGRIGQHDQEQGRGCLRAQRPVREAAGADGGVGRVPIVPNARVADLWPPASRVEGRWRLK